MCSIRHGGTPSRDTQRSRDWLDRIVLTPCLSALSVDLVDRPSLIVLHGVAATPVATDGDYLACPGLSFSSPKADERLGADASIGCARAISEKYPHPASRSRCAVRAPRGRRAIRKRWRLPGRRSTAARELAFCQRKDTALALERRRVDTESRCEGGATRRDQATRDVLRRRRSDVCRSGAYSKPSSSRSVAASPPSHSSEVTRRSFPLPRGTPSDLPLQATSRSAGWSWRSLSSESAM